MTHECYCKVYVDFEGDASVLKKLLADKLGGAIKGRTVVVCGLLVDVFQNTATGSMPHDDFVRWPVYLEVESERDEGAFDSYFESLAMVLRALKAEGCRLVPSCDFEEPLLAAIR